MRCRLYARVSHTNGDQDPEVQLIQLRAFAAGVGRGWEVAGEYVDRASAVNAKRRTAWARLLRDVRAGEAVMVWRLDRAFRSVLQAAQDVEALQARGVKFVSQQEGFDLTTPTGEALFGMLCVFAQFERRVIQERIIAGIRKVQATGRTKSGKPIGRPVGWRKRGAEAAQAAQ